MAHKTISWSIPRPMGRHQPIMKSQRTITRRTVWSLTAGVIALVITTDPSWAAAAKKQDDRGRYLVIIAGCNDCHTAGYADAAGKIPEKDWLTGDRIGWRGPWGTTYASNLRLAIHKLTEEQWLTTAWTVEFRPPMPWYILREMTDQDLRAIYRFIRGLGPAGNTMPDFVPPDREPPQPYILFPAAP
jgi:mono/diheme cytochrome c family protein